MSSWDPDVRVKPMGPEEKEFVRELLRGDLRALMEKHWSHWLEPDNADLGDHAFKYFSTWTGKHNVVVAGCVKCCCRAGHTEGRSTDGHVQYSVAVRVAHLVIWKYGSVCAEAACLRTIAEVQEA